VGRITIAKEATKSIAQTHVIRKPSIGRKRRQRKKNVLNVKGYFYLLMIGKHTVRQGAKRSFATEDAKAINVLAGMIYWL